MQAKDASKKQQKPNWRSIDFWVTCVKAEVFSFQTHKAIYCWSSHGNGACSKEKGQEPSLAAAKGALAAGHMTLLRPEPFRSRDSSLMRSTVFESN